MRRLIWAATVCMIVGCHPARRVYLAPELVGGEWSIPQLVEAQVVNERAVPAEMLEGRVLTDLEAGFALEAPGEGWSWSRGKRERETSWVYVCREHGTAAPYYVRILAKFPGVTRSDAVGPDGLDRICWLQRCDAESVSLFDTVCPTRRADGSKTYAATALRPGRAGQVVEIRTEVPDYTPGLMHPAFAERYSGLCGVLASYRKLE